MNSSLSARHYDHLGRGEPGSLAHNSHQIHNGADDNGSGTTAVLELAEELSRHGPLDRSVLFITFVGEERGLLGSMYLVAHPPVPLDKIVAMVNLDMVGRVRDNVVFVGGNGTAEDFDDVVAAADKDSQLVLKNAGADVGGRGGIGPSDHMAFAMKHIPVLFFWSGMHADYHRPSDKVDKINFLGIAQVVDFTQEIIEKLAAMPREEYIDKYDHNMMGGVAGMKVRLGIMPDYNTDENVTGVRIAGTIPDAPAAKAGLLEGDLIVQIDAEKIDSLGDYMTVLSRHKPGDVVKITIEAQQNQNGIARDALRTQRMKSRRPAPGGVVTSGDHDFMRAETRKISRQQHLQILFPQLRDQTVVRGDDRVGQIAFGLVQLQHFFLHRVLARSMR